MKLEVSKIIKSFLFVLALGGIIWAPIIGYTLADKYPIYQNLVIPLGIIIFIVSFAGLWLLLKYPIKRGE